MSRITIFEGPDGSGKSTAATTYALNHGARLVHSGPFPGVKRHLARFYVEAMLPALLGYQDVVMDRCWLSEDIYGRAFREGQDRLGNVCRRMLERVAMRCETRVFLCLPPAEVCLKTFRARRGTEMLSREEQLLEVHKGYDVAFRVGAFTSLPVNVMDYTDPKTYTLDEATTPHPLGSRSAGNLKAAHVLVGEAFANHTDADALFQAPFVAFGDGGCSKWLARQLDVSFISERELLWVNADDPFLEAIINIYPRKQVIGMGMKAQEKLSELRIDHKLVEHPQHAKRFNYKKPYRLISHLLHGDL